MIKTYEEVKPGLLAEYDSAQADHPDFWENVWGERFAEGLRRASTGRLAEVAFLVKRLPRRGRILEAGCGTGRVTAALQARGYDVVGVDFAADTIARAKAILPSLKLEVADLRRLPFADRSLSAYIALGVVEHFRSPLDVEQIFSEARRVTTGPIFISVPYLSPAVQSRFRKGGLPALQGGQPFYQYYYDQVAFRRLLEHHGLSPRHYVYYATTVGLERHSRVYAGLHKRSLWWRRICNRSRGLWDQVLGKQLAHMFGAWCYAQEQ